MARYRRKLCSGSNKIFDVEELPKLGTRRRCVSRYRYHEDIRLGYSGEFGCLKSCLMARGAGEQPACSGVLELVCKF